MIKSDEKKWKRHQSVRCAVYELILDIAAEEHVTNLGKFWKLLLKGETKNLRKFQIEQSGQGPQGVLGRDLSWQASHKPRSYHTPIIS